MTHETTIIRETNQDGFGPHFCVVPESLGPHSDGLTIKLINWEGPVPTKAINCLRDLLPGAERPQNWDAWFATVYDDLAANRWADEAFEADLLADEDQLRELLEDELERL